MLQEPRLTQLTATNHHVNVVYHIHDLLLDHIRVFLKESDVKASIILMDHVTYSTYCVSCALFDIMFIIFHWIELEVKTNCCSLHNHLVCCWTWKNIKPQTNLCVTFLKFWPPRCAAPLNKVSELTVWLKHVQTQTTSQCLSQQVSCVSQPEICLIQTVDRPKPEPHNRISSW